MEVIRTERLTLRNFEEADWKAVHNYAFDLEVVGYVDWGPNTKEETQNFIWRAIARQQEQPCRCYDFAVVFKFGFKKLNLHRIFAACDPANIRSARVLEKIGM